MARRLIVIYNKLTGEVLRAVPGGSITSRRQLLNYVPGGDLGIIAFYYEEEGADIDFINDRVLRLVHGQPPLLCDSVGYPKLFGLFIKNRRAAIEAATHIKVDFEGGLGDQIMQLEAIKGLRKLRPSLRITIGLHTNYWNIAPFFEHQGDYAQHGKPDTGNRRYYYITNATEFISDPRGNHYGKASLYGASVGLERVQEKIIFGMPQQKIEYWAMAAGIDIAKKKQPLLTIHIRSGSGGAKSWNMEHAQVLAAIWHTKTGGDIYLCGDPNDWRLPTEWAFTLPNRCDWASVGAVILKTSLLVCIDSGPMHLARAASIPHICLWGGTGPKDILGRDEIETDLRANIPCINQICYACPNGTSLCMKAIQPHHVWQAIEKNFSQLLSQSQTLPSEASLRVMGV